MVITSLAIIMYSTNFERTDYDFSAQFLCQNSY